MLFLQYPWKSHILKYTRKNILKSRFSCRVYLCALGQHCASNFLLQCWPRLLSIIFLCKVVCGLWVNIAKVIFLYNVGSGRSRPHCIYRLFSCKNVCAPLANICTSIFLVQSTLHKNLVQCCLRGSRHCTGKILFNVVLILLGQHYTGKYLMQCCPRGSRQQCTGKNSV